MGHSDRVKAHQHPGAKLRAIDCLVEPFPNLKAREVFSFSALLQGNTQPYNLPSSLAGQVNPKFPKSNVLTLAVSVY